MSGQATGFELALDWRPAAWWRVQASYTQFNLTLALDTDNSQDFFGSVSSGEGATPEHQFSLRSSMDLDKAWELDLWVYYADDLPTAGIGGVLTDVEIEDYTSLNARLGWHPRNDLELSLVGQNLQGESHSEFISQYYNELSELERSIYLKILWNF
jgi:iron complex outermembrane receptor protein